MVWCRKGYTSDDKSGPESWTTSKRVIFIVRISAGLVVIESINECAFVQCNFVKQLFPTLQTVISQHEFL